MRYQKCKVNSYPLAGRNHSSTIAFEGDKTGQKLFIDKWVQYNGKKSESVGDNTIRLQGQINFFGELALSSVTAGKKLIITVMKIL